MGPDHLSRLVFGESGDAIDDQLLDTNLLEIEAIPNYLTDILLFLTSGKVLDGYSTIQKKHLVTCATKYQLIVGQLHKLGLDIIPQWFVLDHEWLDILWEFHNGVVGGHGGGKDTTQKILQARLWWPTILNDSKEYAWPCNVSQWTGKPSWQDEIPLHPFQVIQPFEKWVVDFIGHITRTTRHSQDQCITTIVEYLTRWMK